MKALVEYIARGLVATPDEVEVSDGDDDAEGRKVIELRVAVDDRGKVIGKKGRVAHNIRLLLAAASAGSQQITLDIVDS